MLHEARRRERLELRDALSLQEQAALFEDQIRAAQLASRGRMGPSNRMNPRRLRLAVLLLLIGTPTALHAQRAVDPKECIVRRIIDGDTFECGISRARFSVRLLGIDAPEARQRPFGPRATARLQKLLPIRSKVLLELDVRERDRYGRVLAYVWTNDALMVNEEMLRAGFALVDIEPPDVKYAEALRAAAREAQDARAGLWTTNAFDCTPAQFRRKKCA